MKLNRLSKKQLAKYYAEQMILPHIINGNKPCCFACKGYKLDHFDSGYTCKECGYRGLTSTK